MSNSENSTRPSFGILDLLVVILSLYVLGALVADTFFELDEELSTLLQLTDDLICAFFLFDFVVRFRRAENKWSFMKWGWIDLLASIPMLDQFRVGRLVRLMRLVRLLRVFRSVRHLVTYFFRSKTYGTFSSALIVAILMVLGSSIAILQFEKGPEGNIQTAEDALWWSYVTMTTVGYGDKYPVTTEGRAIAVILMTVGIGLFGTFTALLASWFVKEKKNEQVEEEQIDQDTIAPKAKVKTEEVV